MQKIFQILDVNMVIRLKDVQLVVPDGQSWSCHRGDIWIRDGIVSLRPGTETAVKVIAGNNCVAIPSLVNSHHHIYSHLAKGLPLSGSMRNFPEILHNLWWKLDSALDNESVRLSTILSIRECIRHGVTTVFDHHSSPNAQTGILQTMADVFAAEGMRGSICLEISGRNGSDVFDKAVEETRSFTGTPDVRPLLGLHAGFTLSDRELARAAEIPLPVHIHVAEDPVDRKHAEQLGTSVLERLNRFGLLRPNSLLIHGNDLTASDLNVLTDPSIRIVQNIESAMNNTVQPADPALLTDRGIPVLAGTDGMTTNMLKAYKTAFLHLRARRGDPTCGFTEIMAQWCAAYILKNDFGFGCGVKEGEEADLILTDYSPGIDITPETWPGHFLYGVTESRVRTVIRGNRVLLDEYELTDNPHAGIIANCERIIRGLHERLRDIERKGEQA
jgi:cytosine/adenosine deaminase-related metal-dependent hydrolase